MLAILGHATFRRLFRAQVVALVGPGLATVAKFRRHTSRYTSPEVLAIPARPTE